MPKPEYAMPMAMVHEISVAKTSARARALNCRFFTRVASGTNEMLCKSNVADSKYKTSANAGSARWAETSVLIGVAVRNIKSSPRPNETQKAVDQI